MRFQISLFIFLISGLVEPCRGDLLPVEHFLEQVRMSNSDYRAMREEGEGAVSSSRAASLFFKPRAFANAQYIYDPRDTHTPALEGDRQIGRQLSLGLQEQTPWGVQLQLSMDYSQNTLLGTTSPLVTKPTINNLYPVPGFRISLWQNLFGRSDRADYRRMEAESLARGYGKSFGAQATLVDAEGRYWKLATLREAIRLERESLDRAQGLLKVEMKKRAKRLTDPSDVLLGQAAVDGKDLELRSYLAEERAAARAFNVSRGVDSDSVPEALKLPDPKEVLNLSPPEGVRIRYDLRSAEQQSVAAREGYEMAREKLLPELSLYGSIFAVGLNLTVPLDQGVVKEARDGYARQAGAAELAYQRRIFESESDWKDLLARFKDTRERLTLAMKLEDVQRRKFEEIQRKRREGLTITFQVFQYELDYLSATQTRLQLQGTLLGLLAQMKLYGSAQ